MEKEKSTLLGPLLADSLEDNDSIIDEYIVSGSGTDILDDKYISSIVGDERVVISGVRGTGKTMILKVANEVIKKDLDHKFHYINDWDLDENDKKILPVFISFSGFKDEVSLQDDSGLNTEEIRNIKDIFRSYFFINILQEVLMTIENLNLDEEIEFNFFGLRTRFGIKKEIDRAIRDFKRKGFQEIVNCKENGVDTGIKIKAFQGALNVERKTEIKEILLNDMQKVSLFKETIDSICETYGFDKIMFLFDEVHYLGYLQSEFFDTLFGFRGYKRIGYAISIYPAFMDYGDRFDIPDDAKEVFVSNTLYKPTKEQYEQHLIDLLEKRIKIYSNFESILDIINENVLKQLIVMLNGNPRMLLQSVDYLYRNNGQGKIKISDFNQNEMLDIANKWYIVYYKKQAKRYKTSPERAKQFLDVITSRLKSYNLRNEMATVFFALCDEICDEYIETIDLLIYSRIIEKVKLSSFGGQEGTKGVLYSLTPIVGCYYSVFTNKQISTLSKCIKYSIDKDSKIQFASKIKFDQEIGTINKYDCPRAEDGRCEEYLCNGTYSEKWPICPFTTLPLDVVKKTSKEIGIDVLGLSDRLQKRLREADINTLHDIIVTGKSGLQNIQYIKKVRANMIYDMTKEYIDDNL